MEYEDLFKPSDISYTKYGEVRVLRSENVVVDSFQCDTILRMYELQDQMQDLASSVDRPDRWRFRVAVITPIDPKAIGWSRVIQQINSRDFVGVQTVRSENGAQEAVPGSGRTLHTGQISYLSSKWEATAQLVVARNFESGLHTLKSFEGTDRLAEVLAVAKPQLDIQAREARKRSLGSIFLRHR